MAKGRGGSGPQKYDGRKNMRAKGETIRAPAPKTKSSPRKKLT